jgi:hypothetical protein
MALIPEGVLIVDKDLTSVKYANDACLNHLLTQAQIEDITKDKPQPVI